MRRRSRMPVRVTIHSSLVSTIFSRSALESTRSGSARPVPTMVAPRMRSSFGIDAPQQILDVRVHPLLDERGGAQHAAADGARGRAAVADQDDAVDAKQRRAPVLGGRELLAQAGQP